MRRMAIAARRRNHQSLQQSPSVNAVIEVRCHIGIFHAIVGVKAGVIVAFPAGLGQVQLEDRRG